MNTTCSLWQRKLLAFLHDPPEKAYDYTVQHEQRAETHASAFGISKDQWKAFRDSDWTAAAADRFVFPKAAPGERSLGEGVAFVHPLSGAHALSATDYPTKDEAGSIVGSVRPAFEGAADDQDRFWLVWRLWMEYVASHAEGQKSQAFHLPYLPADTRIPDGSIWHHNAVVSALECTRGEDDVRRPAFLLFQLGPVQEFIAQARSTRDLWSGSYLLSWLMAHAIQSVCEKLGPDCIIFPSLRGQPLIDWLNQERLKMAKYPGSMSYWDAIAGKNGRAFQELVLTPNLPNRFLAVVPQDFDANAVEKGLLDEWHGIASACKRWLESKGCPVKHADRFDAQVGKVWQICWQLWPWLPTKDAMEAFKRIPLGKESSLFRAYGIAHSISESHKDGRCYRNGELDPGWAWNAHYQLCQHRLDARRQTREFPAWQGVEQAVKDDYSGKEEEVLDDQWRKAAARHPELAHLFRKENEHLGAANLIKRIWHKAYLENEHELKTARESFDSVPAIASAPFAARVFDHTATPGPNRNAMLAFMKAAADARDDFSDAIAVFENNEERWFAQTDASVFLPSVWARALGDKELPPTSRGRLTKGRNSLRGMLKQIRFGPSSYYAVLALDGDEIGKWLSGEKTPPVGKVLTPAAAEYFKANVRSAAEWLGTPRPVSPSYHLQFSEALSNFGLYCARRIVESHHGQLIYAGGDDVLAMLPAEEAIPCAQGLCTAFRGDLTLAQRYERMFKPTKPGFVWLNDGEWKHGARRPSEPSWPLLVPGGAASASVGISVGHIKEPLQDMIQAAQAAEKRAKNEYGRNALALTVFKRSGEQIEWGTKFRPEPFDLLDFLNRGDTYKPPVDDPKKGMPIPGKFPYRVCELLRVYDPLPDFTERCGAEPLTPELRAIAARELQWIVEQFPGGKKHGAVFGGLHERMIAWLAAVHETRRPLKDFYNLFAVEAFIARQGE